mgnify:CR=1 FL=1
MSFGATLSFILGLLGPAAMLTACVFELLAKRLRKNPRCDKKLVERRQTIADAGLVAAWLLLAAAYLCFQRMAPDAAALEGRFQTWMTGVLLALLVLDIVYLVLRRSRPRQEGQKKHFWEM